MTRASLPPVAVIGAGFSGTMAALQLLSVLPPERPVLLCERAGIFGRGLAYGTGNPAHLLNVRTANMSAFPDRPGHFESWLGHLGPEDMEGIRSTPAGTFASRGLYGRYLTELLSKAVTGSAAGRLRLLPDAVTDLEPHGGAFRLRTEGGQSFAVAGAVLAMGNLAAAPARSRHSLDPWDADHFGRLHPHAPVLILGTGLTMLDAVASLRAHGFEGAILALSRRGLLPNAHAPAAPWPTPNLTPAEFARCRGSSPASGPRWRGRTRKGSAGTASSTPCARSRTRSGAACRHRSAAASCAICAHSGTCTATAPPRPPPRRSARNWPAAPSRCGPGASSTWPTNPPRPW